MVKRTGVIIIVIAIIIVVIVSLIFLCWYICKPQQQGVELDVVLRPKEERFWCWAACGEMVTEYLGHPILQCQQASDYVNSKYDTNIDCCQPNRPGMCNRTGTVNFGTYGFTCDTIYGPQTWDHIVVQIKHNRKPFCYTRYNQINPFRGEPTGHMMVVTGYRIIGDSLLVKIHNPDPYIPDNPSSGGDVEFIPYDRYAKIQGDYKHYRDLYNITYTGIILQEGDEE